MKPLYIPSTDTMIIGEKHRYINPTTGEVYGGTDYTNPQKLEEIGAIPLTLVEPQSGKVADGWEIVIEDGMAYRRPLKEVDPPLPVELSAEEKLIKTDEELIRLIPARTYEDIINHIINAGVFVKQNVKDKITERNALRSQI